MRDRTGLGAPAEPGPAAPGRVHPRLIWLLVALLSAVTSAGADGPMDRRPEPDVPWAHDVTLSPAERRELDALREALEARAGEVGGPLGPCGDLRSLVRDRLAGIQHVRGVEVGLVLFTSYPPRMPVTFATALGSGRVVRDRLTVIVPVLSRIVPLDGGVPAPPRCRPTS